MISDSDDSFVESQRHFSSSWGKQTDLQMRFPETSRVQQIHVKCHLSRDNVLEPRSVQRVSKKGVPCDVIVLDFTRCSATVVRIDL
nr:unnamed protein product [Fasciola hepatica]